MCRQERVVHRRVGHEAVGEHLQRGQHHVFAVVAQHGAQVGGVFVHLQVEQETAAVDHAEVPRPGLRIAARLENACRNALLDVLLGVVDHALPERLCEVATRLHAAHQVGHHRRVVLDLGHLREPVGRVGGAHGLGLGLAHHLGDVVVACLAQALLGPEVVDHQRGGHACGLGDGPQPDVEPVLAPQVDCGIADPGDGRSIVGS